MREYNTLFWDFDGVVKESVEVKAKAYIELFESFGEVISSRVRNHHERNGGMSRFEKIPLYLEWSGQAPSEMLVGEYCSRFSMLVTDRVINAAWVPGVEEYLKCNLWRQRFILVSATPDEELQWILVQLGLLKCFSMIYGASVSKRDAIGYSINQFNLDPTECLMIGDAQSDFQAALANGVPFLLRRHATNVSEFKDYDGPSITDFASI